MRAQDRAPTRDDSERGCVLDGFGDPAGWMPAGESDFTRVDGLALLLDTLCERAHTDRPAGLPVPLLLESLSALVRWHGFLDVMSWLQRLRGIQQGDMGA